MRRLLCVAILASLGFPLGAHAAPATNIGCAAALRLSPDTFSIVYTTRAHDLSEISQDAAYHYWGSCEREATAKTLAGNVTLSTRIATLRDHFVRVQNSEALLAILRAGGGSFYSHLASRAEAGREQMLADIADLEASGLGRVESVEAGQLIDPAAKSIGDRLTRVQHPTAADLRFSTRAAWDKAASAYVEAVHATMQAAGTRKDVSRATILGFVNNPLFLDTPVGTP